ncbi:unnamed protein product [Closterium sp. Naga37s-1]|nr:unnamed protein product [Closterium sp. Naga37s-1]
MAVYPVRTALARLFVIVWLIISLLIVTMYTANLTSIVTVKRLKPSTMDIGSAAMGSSAIGYQLGSFVYAYLLHMGIPANRLVALNSEDEYAAALTSGRVGMIVDESPYLQLFSRRFCDVAVAPQPFSLLNLAFAFPKGSQVGEDISQAIVQLTMLGELQQIREKYFSGINASCSRPTSSNSAISSSSSSSSSPVSLLAADSVVQLSMHKFLGLYIILAAVSLGCCLLYVLLLIHRGYRASREAARQQDAQNQAEIQRLVFHHHRVHTRFDGPDVAKPMPEKGLALRGHEWEGGGTGGRDYLGREDVFVFRRTATLSVAEEGEEEEEEEFGKLTVVRGVDIGETEKEKEEDGGQGEEMRGLEIREDENEEGREEEGEKDEQVAAAGEQALQPGLLGEAVAHGDGDSRPNSRHCSRPGSRSSSRNGSRRSIQGERLYSSADAYSGSEPKGNEKGRVGRYETLPRLFEGEGSAETPEHRQGTTFEVPRRISRHKLGRSLVVRSRGGERSEEGRAKPWRKREGGATEFEQRQAEWEERGLLETEGMVRSGVLQAARASALFLAMLSSLLTASASSLASAAPAAVKALGMGADTGLKAVTTLSKSVVSGSQKGLLSLQETVNELVDKYNRGQQWSKDRNLTGNPHTAQSAAPPHAAPMAAAQAAGQQMQAGGLVEGDGADSAQQSSKQQRFAPGSGARSSNSSAEAAKQLQAAVTLEAPQKAVGQSSGARSWRSRAEVVRQLRMVGEEGRQQPHLAWSRRAGLHSQEGPPRPWHRRSALGNAASAPNFFDRLDERTRGSSVGDQLRELLQVESGSRQVDESGSGQVEESGGDEAGTRGTSRSGDSESGGEDPEALNLLRKLCPKESGFRRHTPHGSDIELRGIGTRCNHLLHHTCTLLSRAPQARRPPHS